MQFCLLNLQAINGSDKRNNEQPKQIQIVYKIQLGDNVEFIQLNKNWKAEPNAPMPKIEVSGQNLKLSFYLNAFIFKKYDEDDLGVLGFYNCRQYRVGAPNEDGFYIYNQSRYKNYGVKWGEFYLIQNSDWLNNFPRPVYIDTTIEKRKLNHYLFYFRDETFECVSEGYFFRVIKSNT